MGIEMSPMQLLVLGHITRDYIAGQERLGGAASYATRVASCLGLSTGLVTYAPLGSPLLPRLEELSDCQLHRLNSDVPTTFELVYEPEGRTIRLLERAPTLSLDDIPAHFLNAPAAYLAPVMNECPLDFITGLPSPIKVAGLQGWLRRAQPDGRVVPKPFDTDSMPSGLTAVVFSDEDHPDAEALARGLSARIPYVVLTRGADGLTLFQDTGVRHLPALPVEATDPTGAGDTLAAALTAGLVHGLPINEALERAIVAASLVVQGPELGQLATQGPGLFVREASGADLYMTPRSASSRHDDSAHGVTPWQRTKLES